MSEGVRQPSSGRPDRVEVVDVVLEDGGDTTVRPCSPTVKAFLDAQRERLRRWEERNAPPPANGTAPEGP